MPTQTAQEVYSEGGRVVGGGEEPKGATKRADREHPVARLEIVAVTSGTPTMSVYSRAPRLSI